MKCSIPIALSLIALTTLAGADPLPHLPLSPPVGLPLPDSSKIAAYYTGTTKTLYVFHKQKLLNGIQGGKYTVDWDGQAGHAAVHVGSSSVHAKVVTGVPFSSAIGRLERVGTQDTKLLMVFGCQIKEQPASLGPPQKLTSRLTLDQTPKTWRLAKRHITYLRGNGHQMGQEFLGVCFERYVYESSFGHNREIGEMEYPPSFHLTDAEWPNP